MRTNELVLNKMLDLHAEVLDLRRERDMLRRSVVVWTESNGELERIIVQVEAENDDLISNVAGLKESLTSANIEIESLKAKLARFCKKK